MRPVIFHASSHCYGFLMSSITTSSDDERLEKPVAERKSAGVQIKEPPFDLHYVRHNVADYALYLCRGRKSSREFSNKYEVGLDQDENNTRLVVLDESGTFVIFGISPDL